MDIQRWDIYTRPTLNNQSIESVYTYTASSPLEAPKKGHTDERMHTRTKRTHTDNVLYLYTLTLVIRLEVKSDAVQGEVTDRSPCVKYILSQTLKQVLQ